MMPRTCRDWRRPSRTSDVRADTHRRHWAELTGDVVIIQSYFELADDPASTAANSHQSLRIAEQCNVCKCSIRFNINPGRTADCCSGLRVISNQDVGRT